MMNKPSKSTARKGQVQYLNPSELHQNPAFTNVVTVSGPVRTIYVGGQNAVEPSGNIVGKGDFKAQSEQILKNLEAALAAGGAQWEHVVRMNIYVVQGQPLQEGFAAFQNIWGDRSNPPAVSVLFVAGLAHPDFLAEIDAIAVIPQ
jgi:enamine deaminase RidA (YjgF/YER057c/UK114 family)